MFFTIDDCYSLEKTEYSFSDCSDDFDFIYDFKRASRISDDDLKKNYEHNLGIEFKTFNTLRTETKIIFESVFRIKNKERLKNIVDQNLPRVISCSEKKYSIDNDDYLEQDFKISFDFSFNGFWRIFFDGILVKVDRNDYEHLMSFFASYEILVDENVFTDLKKFITFCELGFFMFKKIIHSDI